MVVAGLAITAIIIIIITISLWPNQSSRDERKGEAGTDKQENNSKFNLINIHRKKTNEQRELKELRNHGWRVQAPGHARQYHNMS